MGPSLPSKPTFQLKSSSNSLFQTGKTARLARIAGAIVAIVVALSLIFRFNNPRHQQPISRLAWTSYSKSGTYDPTNKKDTEDRAGTKVEPTQSAQEDEAETETEEQELSPEEAAWVAWMEELERSQESPEDSPSPTSVLLSVPTVKEAARPTQS